MTEAKVQAPGIRLSVKVATGPEQGLKPVVDRSFKTVGEAFRCEESGERFSKIAVEL